MVFLNSTFCAKIVSQLGTFIKCTHDTFTQKPHSRNFTPYIVHYAEAQFRRSDPISFLSRICTMCRSVLCDPSVFPNANFVCVFVGNMQIEGNTTCNWVFSWCNHRQREKENFLHAQRAQPKSLSSSFLVAFYRQQRQDQPMGSLLHKLQKCRVSGSLSIYVCEEFDVWPVGTWFAFVWLCRVCTRSAIMVYKYSCWNIKELFSGIEIDQSLKVCKKNTFILEQVHTMVRRVRFQYTQMHYLPTHPLTRMRNTLNAFEEWVYVFFARGTCAPAPLIRQIQHSSH